MILRNEFTVGADVETVWRHLLDMEGVATCLPGATVNATDEENTYDGTMRLKIGPMKVEYRGSARLQEIDEQQHSAVVSLSAREAKGHGTAIATIHNQLEEVEGGTRVRAQTDLNITGPQAQFGHGVIEDVGRRVMDEFSHRLEQRIAADESGAAEGLGTPDPAAHELPESSRIPTSDDVLDLGAFVPPSVVKRAAGILVALVLAVLVLRRWRD
jgi:carbon monoxide dehydrogenase subunit G